MTSFLKKIMGHDMLFDLCTATHQVNDIH